MYCNAIALKIAPLLLFLMGVMYQAGAQKVKYKDLYPLFQAQKYEETKPFLQAFLAKEPDHPNANLQMGITFDILAHDTDVLRETEKSVAYADSAVMYYNRARQYIDDREVRKNDEYYEAYMKRDLRTGKFGIEVDNVHYDIEKKIDAIRQFSAATEKLRMQFDEGVQAYEQAMAHFADIKAAYETDKKLKLRYSDSTDLQLDQLSVAFDSSQLNFNTYTQLLEEMGTDQYSQTFRIINPVSLVQTDTTLPDFYSSQVDLINFSKWASDTKYEVVTDVLPLRQSWNKMHDALAAAYSRLSAEEPLDIPALDAAWLDKSKALDENALPVALFTYQRSDLALKKQQQDFENAYFLDTVAVEEQIDRYDILLHNGEDVWEKYQILREVSGGEGLRNYEQFINQHYQGEEAYQTYLKAQEVDYLEFKMAANRQKDSLEHALYWARADSLQIPVFLVDTAMHIGMDTLDYHTHHLARDTADYVLLAGLSADSMQIFMAETTPWRSLSLFSFDLADTLKSDSVQIHHSFQSLQVPKAKAMLYHSYRGDSVGVARLYYLSEGEIAWKVDLDVKYEPSLNFDATKNQLLVFQKDGSSPPLSFNLEGDRIVQEE